MSEAVLPQRNAISRLWNDKETRAVIIQVIALVLILGFGASMIRNAAVNIDAIGKGFSFKFLTQSSNYDINQHFIEYTSQSTHFRAMMVGLINTILVAVCGIILSSVLGFTLGVLRLSKNWLTNKLAYVYIEYVRNVPVLLHILLVHGLIVHSLPVPKNAMNFGDTAFLTNRGLFTPKPELEPLFWIVFGLFVAGVVFMLWFRAYAQKVQDQTGKHYPVALIGVGAVIGIPFIAYFILGSALRINQKRS